MWALGSVGSHGYFFLPRPFAQKIAKKEATIKKKTEVTSADVEKTQKKLETELEFEEFGFGGL